MFFSIDIWAVGSAHADSQPSPRDCLSLPFSSPPGPWSGDLPISARHLHVPVLNPLSPPSEPVLRQCFWLTKIPPLGVPRECLLGVMVSACVQLQKCLSPVYLKDDLVGNKILASWAGFCCYSVFNLGFLFGCLQSYCHIVFRCWSLLWRSQKPDDPFAHPPKGVCLYLCG